MTSKFSVLLIKCSLTKLLKQHKYEEMLPVLQPCFFLPHTSFQKQTSEHTITVGLQFFFYATFLPLINNMLKSKCVPACVNPLKVSGWHHGSLITCYSRLLLVIPPRLGQLLEEDKDSDGKI